ncbi:magnesium transporter CorA family protein [Saccharibacillus deserti]|uniref:magnesium transporter CorA family protein n=1 Tax=Saccharibacillus deserti TaxID=1634444 RepID=UPI0015581E7A|nr:magnesium transporter CorA family protein [Saccharibacillus deserti]
MRENKADNRSENWRWYRFRDIQEASEHADFGASVKEWLTESVSRVHNRTRAVSHLQEGPVLSGTLALGMNPEKQGRRLLLHYYVTERQLMTIGSLDEMPVRMNLSGLYEAVERCPHPVEGLLTLAGEVLETFFIKVDEIEKRVTEVEEAMSRRNDKFMLKRIIGLRSDLTYWNSQAVPVKEIRFAAEEVFHETLGESGIMHRLQLRLNRVGMLQKEYGDEIDSLLRVDDNLTNYRSNDIMKALTVYTVMLTPTTALGAIWGMNFEHMPELGWKWGYAASLLFILGSTVATYLWLKRRQLTGDLLRMDMRSGKDDSDF